MDRKPPHLMEYINYKALIDHKRKIKNLEMQLGRFNMILNLKAVDGLLMIQSVLHKLEISKQIFVENISQGSEVQIPRDLSTDIYPLSFCFYDFILMYI